MLHKPAYAVGPEGPEGIEGPPGLELSVEDFGRLVAPHLADAARAEIAAARKQRVWNCIFVGAWIAMAWVVAVAWFS